MDIFNKEWRMANLYYIVNKDGQKVLFNSNAIQDRIRQCQNPRKFVLKARQFGVSTGALLDQFDDTIFTPNTTSLIMAHENDAVTKLFRIIARAYMFMPDQLKPVIAKGGGSKHELYFPEINSRIYCDLESRSDTIQRLHISEAAFMKDANKIYSTLQAVPLSSGKVTIESTPNGMNHFFDMWNDENSVYEKMFFPWYIYPDYKLPVSEKLELTDEELELKIKAKKVYGIDLSDEQIQFRRFKKAELRETSTSKSGKRVLFIQEYPEDDKTCFLTSGDAVLDMISVSERMLKAPQPIYEKNGFTIYKKFEKGKTYVCGADVAEGVGGDWSVGVVMEAHSREVVAVARGQWKPFDFAQKLNNLCKLYTIGDVRWPLLAVERNNHGHAVLLELEQHIGYKNLYKHNDDRAGWKTDSVTRPIMINTFIDAVENKYITINDKNIFSECLTLVNNKGKIEAADNKHDDCIIASAIALQMAVNLTTIHSVYENIRDKIK